MQVKLPFFILLIVLTTVPVYGEEVPDEEEHEVSYVRGAIDAMFDAIGDFGRAQTDDTTWFDDEKKEQINEVNEHGVNTGKTAIELWWSFHEFVVNAIFAGSPIPFDKGIAIVIGFVLSSILVFFLLKDFIKKTWKIGAVLIAVIAIILILGIEAPTI